jgi:hypothetical protein
LHGGNPNGGDENDSDSGEDVTEIFSTPAGSGVRTGEDEGVGGHVNANAAAAAGLPSGGGKGGGLTVDTSYEESDEEGGGGGDPNAEEIEGGGGYITAAAESHASTAAASLDSNLTPGGGANEMEIEMETETESGTCLSGRLVAECSGRRKEEYCHPAHYNHVATTHVQGLVSSPGDVRLEGQLCPRTPEMISPVMFVSTRTELSRPHVCTFSGMDSGGLGGSPLVIVPPPQGGLLPSQELTGRMLHSSNALHEALTRTRQLHVGRNVEGLAGIYEAVKRQEREAESRRAQVGINCLTTPSSGVDMDMGMAFASSPSKAAGSSASGTNGGGPPPLKLPGFLVLDSFSRLVQRLQEMEVQQWTLWDQQNFRRLSGAFVDGFMRASGQGISDLHLPSCIFLLFLLY